MHLIINQTIQCKHPETGKTGDWAFIGDDHTKPGTTVSPIFSDYLSLCAWGRDQGFKPVPGLSMQFIVPSSHPPLIPLQFN